MSDFPHVMFDFDGTIIEVHGGKLKLYIHIVWLCLEHFVPRVGMIAAWKVFVRAFGKICNHTGKLSNWQSVFEAWSETTARTESEISTLAQEFVSKRMVHLRRHFRPIASGVELVRATLASGKKIVIATNPLYPISSTHQRLSWVGLNPDDFILITGLENSYGAKPQIRYYQGILNALKVSAQDCVMIGNDPFLDLAATRLGIQCHLVATEKVLKRFKTKKVQKHLRQLTHWQLNTYQQLKQEL